MQRNEIENMFKALAGSQGYYGRLLRNLDSVSEDTREEFYAQFADCQDMVDVIMRVEG